VFRSGDPTPESESLPGYSSIYTNMLYAPHACATGWGRVTYGSEYDEVTTAQAC
jgi:hypothetical protein